MKSCVSWTQSAQNLVEITRQNKAEHRVRQSLSYSACVCLAAQVQMGFICCLFLIDVLPHLYFLLVLSWEALWLPEKCHVNEPMMGGLVDMGPLTHPSFDRQCTKE